MKKTIMTHILCDSLSFIYVGNFRSYTVIGKMRRVW